jgi:hypothetical protein
MPFHCCLSRLPKLFLIGMLLVACAPSSEQAASQVVDARISPSATRTNPPTATSTSRPTATPTNTPAPTSTSTPMPIQVPAWESAGIYTVCLEIHQTYTNVEGDFSLPVDALLSRVLGRMGIEAVGSGDECDAQLSIDITAQALSGTYNNLGRCYTGATATSRATLAAEGYQSVNTASFTVTEEPHFVASANTCEEEASGAPFYLTSSGALLGNLLQLWGQPALHAGLAEQDPEVRLGIVMAVERSEARAAGLETSDIVFVLMQAFQNDDQANQCWVSGNAAFALGRLGAAAKEAVPLLAQAILSSSCAAVDAIIALEDIGPAAREAVPALIDVLRTGSEARADLASEALVRITGQSFGLDADAWQDWWDSVQE